MNDDLKNEKKKKRNGLTPSQVISWSDISLAIVFACKVKEQERLQELVDRLEEDSEVLFEEIYLRKGSDFDRAYAFIEEVQEYVN